ncbi:MAG TPA: hydrogenase maturation protease [Anaeromyxobacteraceae bacterium]|nr:hydrogenase maturation protease [Anaeromyxobacteraceae bacterium]
MRRIGMLGIGNVLMGDDALGPYVLKQLEARYELPPEVEILDLGTAGADFPLHLEGLCAAVVVDALKLSGSPGEIRLFDKEQLLAKRPLLPMSPHEPGLREALFALEFRGTAPGQVRLVGVIPSRVETGIGLSAEVQAAVPAVLAAVLRELEFLGARVVPRAIPGVPDVWWERSPDKESVP